MGLMKNIEAGELATKAIEWCSNNGASRTDVFEKYEKFGKDLGMSDEQKQLLEVERLAEVLVSAVEQNNIELVEKCLKNEKINISNKDNIEDIMENALNIANKKNHLEIYSLLFHTRQLQQLMKNIEAGNLATKAIEWCSKNGASRTDVFGKYEKFGQDLGMSDEQKKLLKGERFVPGVRVKLIHFDEDKAEHKGWNGLKGTIHKKHTDWELDSESNKKGKWYISIDLEGQRIPDNLKLALRKNQILTSVTDERLVKITDE